MAITRTLADLSWIQVEKDADSIVITASAAQGDPPVYIELPEVDALRLARDILTLAVPDDA